MTDFGRLKNYADYIKVDPFRRALHFPAVEAVLGDPNNKPILDIGCGDGLFARLLAERGASVVGYDKAPEKVAEAQAYKDVRQLDATFVLATPQTFLGDGTFDAVTSVMVLQFATSYEELAAFFRSASRHLGSGGRFISVVLNPTFSAFGQDFVVRRFTKLDENRVRTEFVDRTSGHVEMAVGAPVHARGIRTGRGRRRNAAGGLEETLRDAGCCPTNGGFVLAVVSRASTLRTLCHAKRIGAQCSDASWSQSEGALQAPGLRRSKNASIVPECGQRAASQRRV